MRGEGFEAGAETGEVLLTVGADGGEVDGFDVGEADEGQEDAGAVVAFEVGAVGEEEVVEDPPDRGGRALPRDGVPEGMVFAGFAPADLADENTQRHAGEEIGFAAGGLLVLLTPIAHGVLVPAGAGDGRQHAMWGVAGHPTLVRGVASCSLTWKCLRAVRREERKRPSWARPGADPG